MTTHAMTLRAEIAEIDAFANEQKAALAAKLAEAEAAENERLAAIEAEANAEKLAEASKLAVQAVEAARAADEHLAAASAAMVELKRVEALIRRAAPHAVTWGHQFHHRRTYNGALGHHGLYSHADGRGDGETLRAVTVRLLNRLLTAAERAA